MSTTKLTVASFCSGIGGLDLGLERAGMEIACMCEIEPYAQSILRKHWPGVRLFNNIYDVSGEEISEPIDVVVGGFPCQDVSCANPNAKGLDGKRSGPIFYQIMRIVREIRPKYIILENVAALLDRGLDRVLIEFHLCGYDAEWDTISAASVGAPHSRNRIFIVGIRRDIPDTSGSGLLYRQDEILSKEGRNQTQSESVEVCSIVPNPESERGKRRETRVEGIYPQCKERLSGWNDPRNVSDTDCEFGPRRKERGRQSDSEWQSSEAVRSQDADRSRGSDPGGEPNRTRIYTRKPPRSDYWFSEPPVGRLVDGIPYRLDRLRCLGNAVVPQIGEHIGRLVIEYHERTGGLR